MYCAGLKGLSVEENLLLILQQNGESFLDLKYKNFGKYSLHKFIQEFIEIMIFEILHFKEFLLLKILIIYGNNYF